MELEVIFSIIIPIKDRSEYFDKAIKSIVSSDFMNYEIIVVNDHSRPEYLKEIERICKSDERIKLYHLEGDKFGANAARNFGALKAKSDFFVFMDSDDLLGRDFFQERHKQILDYRDFDFWVYPVMLFNHEPGDLDILWNHFEGENDLERFLNVDTVWHTTSTLWRKEFFWKIGGFNERLISWQDWEIHVRALSFSPLYKKIYQNPDIFYRQHEGESISKKNNSVSYFANQLYLLEVILTSIKNGSQFTFKNRYRIAKLSFKFYNLSRDTDYDSLQFLNFIRKNKLIAKNKLMLWQWRNDHYNLLTRLYDKWIYLGKNEHFLDTKTTFLNYSPNKQ